MIETHTLTDGGQSATDVATWLVGFIEGAQRSLDVAMYDFALAPDTAKLVIDAIRGTVARGVAVRVLYNVDHRRPIAVPPPPRTDPALIASLGVDAKPVYGVPDLMHHKFVVKDGRSVWTGSTNWTQDSWTREENVIVVIDDERVAAAYTHDFEDLWRTGTVAGSGEFTPDPIDVGGANVRPLFCPGGGVRLAHRIASAVGGARRRIRVASPVITAGPILGTLAEVASGGRVDLAGVYDATQMHEVFGQWRADPRAGWKIPCFTTLVTKAGFGAKVTTPYGPGTVHDYMHAKICVADETSFVGSYNLSHSGQQNAENVLEIADAALADRLASFVDQIRTRYPAHTPA